MNTWKKISYSLDVVSGINKIAIKEIRIGEWNAGTYFIDDIYLANSTTADVP